MEKTVWITGARGLIGNYLVESAAKFAPNFKVIGLSRAEIDLTDFDAVRDLFRQQSPQLIIHCAALSKSPACQADSPLAHKLNVDVTASWLNSRQIFRFSFFRPTLFSTDAKEITSRLMLSIR
jgi:dTDP-4-dehydrorhamnose reductase